MPSDTLTPDAAARESGASSVVIVGAGFAGLTLARQLSRRHAVTLLDRRNYHLFQPLLYQVVVGAISPGEIGVAVRGQLRHRPNVRSLEAEVFDFDAVGRILNCGAAGGAAFSLTYDTLVVATGMQDHYFGHDDWAVHAPALKTLGGGLRMRARLLGALEAAEAAAARGAPSEEVERLMSVVAVGGGPTGVELAGAIAELSRTAMAGEFRYLDPDDLRIELVEGEPALLNGFAPRLQKHALRGLERLGVNVRLGTMVRAVDADGVTLAGPDGEMRRAAAVVFWAAGVRPTELAGAVAAAYGITPERDGRLAVDGRLALAGHPEVHVLGDIAAYVDPRHGRLPGVAPVAKQQGAFVARLLDDRTRAPFRYRDWGRMAVIGRFDAVAEILGIRLSGRLAWLVWALAHIAYLVGFDRKLRVMVSWGWRFVLGRYAARLITEAR